jgi:hypothetical protein
MSDQHICAYSLFTRRHYQDLTELRIGPFSKNEWAVQSAWPDRRPGELAAARALTCDPRASFDSWNEVRDRNDNYFGGLYPRALPGPAAATLINETAFFKMDGCRLKTLDEPTWAELALAVEELRGPGEFAWEWNSGGGWTGRDGWALVPAIFGHLWGVCQIRRLAWGRFKSAPGRAAAVVARLAEGGLGCPDSPEQFVQMVPAWRENPPPTPEQTTWVVTINPPRGQVMRCAVVTTPNTEESRVRAALKLLANETNAWFDRDAKTLSYGHRLGPATVQIHQSTAKAAASLMLHSRRKFMFEVLEDSDWDSLARQVEVLTDGRFVWRWTSAGGWLGEWNDGKAALIPAAFGHLWTWQNIDNIIDALTLGLGHAYELRAETMAEVAKVVAKNAPGCPPSPWAFEQKVANWRKGAKCPI